MHIVRPLFDKKMGVKTEVWLSDDALAVYEDFRKKGGDHPRFLKHLKRCALAGFDLYTRGDHPIVKWEWSGVYRVGFDFSLFRLIGFFENDQKDCFIVIDGFLKKKQKLSESNRLCIEKVVEVKQKSLWRKHVENKKPA